MIKSFTLIQFCLLSVVASADYDVPSLTGSRGTLSQDKSNMLKMALRSRGSTDNGEYDFDGLALSDSNDKGRSLQGM
jgi:hypothetical protein